MLGSFPGLSFPALVVSGSVLLCCFFVCSVPSCSVTLYPTSFSHSGHTLPHGPSRPVLSYRTVSSRSRIPSVRFRIVLSHPDELYCSVPCCSTVPSRNVPTYTELSRPAIPFCPILPYCPFPFCPIPWYCSVPYCPILQHFPLTFCPIPPHCPLLSYPAVPFRPVLPYFLSSLALRYRRNGKEQCLILS